MKALVTSSIVAALTLASASLLAGGIRADGVIESSAGGFRFPDGTIQVTAASSSVAGTEISSVPFTVSEPGNYYLTSNLTMGSNADAITVEADNVTLDLRGFTLDGAHVGWTGVVMFGRKNVEIRNGTIRGFQQQGVREDDIAGSGHRIIDVRLVDNGVGGVVLASTENLILRVTAVNNGGGSGIQGYEGTVVVNSVARGNNAGINVDAHSLVRDCIATDNLSAGIVSHYDATITGNIVSGNDASGITAGNGSTITGNTITDNNLGGNSDRGGISVFSDCLVRGNTLDENAEANIVVRSSGNVIEGNLMTDSDNGLLFLASGNFYASNRASGNSTNYAENGFNETDGGGNVSF